MADQKKRAHPVGIGMTPCATELGLFVRDRRLALGLTQHQLHECSGLGQRSSSAVETGARRYLKDAQCDALANALQCEPEELRSRMPIKGAQPTTTLGKLIRSRREALGLTIEQFAERMDLPVQKARHIETRRNPTLLYRLLRPLAHALELEPATLAQFTGVNLKHPRNELGRRVRVRRQELGMSMRELAQKLGIRHQYVSLIELGKSSLCASDDMVQQLADALTLARADLEAIRSKRKLKRIRSNNPLGALIIVRRQALGLTQREVARRAGLSASHISGTETGRLPLTRAVLNKIAAALDHCDIPEELLPPVRNNKKTPHLSTRNRTTALGTFVSARRLELQLTQSQLAQRMMTSFRVVSGIERGTHHPSTRMKAKLSAALECEVPADLIL